MGIINTQFSLLIEFFTKTGLDMKKVCKKTEEHKWLWKVMMHKSGNI
jgi:hypothetical protein